MLNLLKRTSLATEKMSCSGVGYSATAPINQRDINGKTKEPQRSQVDAYMKRFKWKDSVIESATK